ncbi:hypothetical protein IEQ34_020465 [Dendrobium chrysotoxum]|uniref:Uncharacterized protein n=1 Tax=Dendrobium chrysotoxum TaxID=161865 RepID=A0AAV7G234_DENCH|nr:hypothetical protein IEQ34_020465 [Dendrobium chrysotoxum]
MAAASDRFSIRDYAAKMRIVDLAKSWPFIGEKDEKPTLPPISICRFRWWTDELSSARYAADAAEIKAAEAEKTNEKPDEIIKRHLPNSPPTATTEKTTEEECLRSPKVKTRMPKKRSIVELFASAPQIEPVDQSNGNDGDGENKKEEEKAMKRKRKGKRRKEAFKMEIRALKKEKVCQPKKISRHSMLRQDLINTKALRKTAKGVVESKKFVKVKTLQNKHLLQTPNLISMNQNVVKKLPIHSILKNKNRFSSARKTSKIKNANTVEFIKRCCKPTRHVTFSEKDDVLGHGNNCSSINLPQFKSLCKIFSDVLTKSSVMSNSRKVHDLPAANDGTQGVNVTEEDINAGVVDRTDESSSQKNLSSDSLGNVNHRKLVNSSNSSCSSTEKASMAIMIDLNHGIETSNDIDCFNPSTENLLPCCTNSVDLDFKDTTNKKGSSTSTEFHLQGGLPKISLAFTTTTEKNFVSASNATALLTTMKNPSPHISTSCLIACNERNEMQCRQYFDVDMNGCHHIPENQSGHLRSSEEFLSNDIGYSVGSNKFRGSAFLSNLVSTSKSTSTGEDFISLPHNKQGEFFQMHPETKFVGPYTKQNIDFASNHGFYANNQVVHNINANPFKVMKEKILDAASYQNDQVDWFQNQYHPTRERIFTEFIGPERVCIQNNEPFKGNYELLHSHANKTKLYFHDGKICDATPDFFKTVDLQQKCNLACQFEPVVQPTIRLMGQNVVVGGGNRDWYTSIMPEKYISNERTLPEFVANTCGSSTGSVLKVSDSLSNFYQTTEHLEPKFDSHIGDHGSESLTRKNIISTTGNNVFKVDVDSNALPHNAFLNKTGKIIENCISGEETSRHQDYPTIASYQHNIQQNRLLSSIHSNHSQGVSCGTFVTAQPQVPYNIHENSFQPVPIQTSEEPPQCLIQAMRQKRNQLSSSPYSDQTELSQPCRLSGTNLIPRISPYNMPMVPFSVHNISPSKNSAFVQNSSQSSFISAVTATNSISESTKSTAIKNKERDESYSNSKGFNSPVDAHKSRKRSAASDDVFMRSAKRPYF